MSSYKSKKLHRSVENHLRGVYANVFDKIYPHIEYKQRGVLYEIVQIILGSDKLKADYLCNKLQIYDTQELNYELGIPLDTIICLLPEINNKEQLLDKNPMNSQNTHTHTKSIIEYIRNNIFKDNKMKLYQIVLVGCFIVGTHACLEYLETEQAQSGSRKSNKTIDPKPETDGPAILSLILPVSAVRKLKKGDLISAVKLKEFIDKALYLLCTNLQDSETNEQSLELEESEDIANANENTEIYVKIEINNGEEMIGHKVAYILKDNLSSDGSYKIINLACLKYLSNSGLEKFNRI